MLREFGFVDDDCDCPICQELGVTLQNFWDGAEREVSLACQAEDFVGSPAAKFAVTLIAEFLKDEGLDWTDHHAFYSAEEWRKREEEFGNDALLVVVHDGGDHSFAFNWDKGRHDLIEKLNRKMLRHNFLVEQCTSWYSRVTFAD